jgi:hypothetical protein
MFAIQESSCFRKDRGFTSLQDRIRLSEGDLETDPSRRKGSREG